MLRNPVVAAIAAVLFSATSQASVMIGAYLPDDGWSSTDITEFNSVFAKSLVFSNIFSGFSSDWDDPYWQSENIFAQGAMPMISWMPIDSARYDTNILSEIVAGEWDTYLDLTFVYR